MYGSPAPSTSGGHRDQVRSVEVRVGERDYTLPQTAIEQVTVFLPAQVLYRMREVCLAFRNVANDTLRQRTVTLASLPTATGTVDTATANVILGPTAVAAFNALLPEQKVETLRTLVQIFPHARIDLSGADVNAAFVDGRTPLHVAVRENQARVVTVLFANGANPNALEAHGFSPLHEAIDKNNAAMVRTLLRHGVDRNFATGDARTPRMLAEERGSVEMINLLVTPEERQDAYSRSLCGLATCFGLSQLRSITLMQQLLHAGGDVNFHYPLIGATPLHMAAMRGNVQVLQWLIERGADVNAVDGRGVSVLAEAASVGHVDTVRLLLAHGAIVTDDIMRLPLNDEMRRLLQAHRRR